MPVDWPDAVMKVVASGVSLVMGLGRTCLIFPLSALISVGSYVSVCRHQLCRRAVTCSDKYSWNSLFGTYLIGTITCYIGRIVQYRAEIAEALLQLNKLQVQVQVR